MPDFYKKISTLDTSGRVLCGIVLLLPLVRLLLHPNTGIISSIPLYYSHISLAEVLFIIAFILTKNRQAPNAPLFPVVFWLGFSLWLAVSVFNLSVAPSYEAAAFKTTQFLIHFAFAITLINYVQHAPKATEIIIPSVIIALLLFLPIFLGTTFLMARDNEHFDWVKSLPGFSNVRHLDYMLGAGLAALGTLPLTHPRILNSLLRVTAFAVLMLALWVLLFWTGGRGSSIAAIASLGICLIWLRPERWQKLFQFNLFILILGAGISAFLPVPDTPSYGLLRFLTKVTEVENVNAFTAGRLVIWQQTIDVWKDSPWLGIGPGQTRNVIVAANNIFTHPHNVFLQAFMAWGILGGLPFLAIFIGSLWSIWQSDELKKSTSAHQICGFAMALAIAVNALVDGTLYHPYPIFLFILGISVALKPSVKTQSASSLERS
ncbi:O-antigen ligase family protein [Luteithermobacter gelatinilyticus]|uniref:O-antigen ligase family protein n=1 Tax=Luteithermobacter gelatinilyticus TaxID=2582913 RepID=UPI00143D9FF3|nr:O-antigen ligase family protein [Luteithermobacter gelatinilyticus]